MTTCLELGLFGSQLGSYHLQLPLGSGSIASGFVCSLFGGQGLHILARCLRLCRRYALHADFEQLINGLCYKPASCLLASAQAVMPERDGPSTAILPSACANFQMIIKQKFLVPKGIWRVYDTIVIYLQHAAFRSCTCELYSILTLTCAHTLDITLNDMT